MHMIIWEFECRPDCSPAFAAAYGPDGEWAQLFRRARGYLGTELLIDRERPGRYITLDRWSSESDYHAFQEQWSAAYAELDRRLESLTVREARLGSFESPAVSSSAG